MEEKTLFEENLYYDQSETPDIFEVTVAENISAERCDLKGDYEFHVCSENFALVDKRSNKRLYTWPFRYIRRYGKSSTNFQFEAGRKCQSGEGLFSLLTNQENGEAIFNLVQTRFTSMQHRDKQYRQGDENQQVKRNNSQLGASPSIPARKYENNEVITSTAATPSSHSRKSTMKPPIITPKPKSIRRPVNAGNSAANNFPTGDSVNNASEINSFIGQNRRVIVNTADDDDNTYSVIGRDEPKENAAQYSAVYVQKPPQSYTVGDDTYDEVHIETKH